MDGQENHDKKNISIQHRGKKAPKMRHRNPGTRDPRIRVLSNVTVVPPRYRSLRITPEYPGPPKTPPRSLTPQIPWREPERIELIPQTSEWRRVRSLIPIPTVDYRYGYEIFAGDAFGTVPLYVDRDRPWVLHEVDFPVTRTVHFYREDVNDPRMHDFRVEVIRQPPPQPLSPSPPEPLQQPPPQPISEPLHQPFSPPLPEPLQQPPPQPISEPLQQPPPQPISEPLHQPFSPPLPEPLQQPPEQPAVQPPAQAPAHTPAQNPTPGPALPPAPRRRRRCRLLIIG